MPKKLKITDENYYDARSALKYCGYTQYKNFCGAGGFKGCEAKAMAMLQDKWFVEPTPSMLVGSYVDAWFEGKILDFEEKHHEEIFNKNGTYRADFIKAQECIERAKRDELFMNFMGGDKQVIMTASMFGMDWKIRMDSYHPNICIVDLKVVKDINEMTWVKDMGKLNFIDYWGYDVQGAIYQKVVEINTGKKLPFFICAIDKGKYPDIEIIQIPNSKLADTLSVVEYECKRIKAVKAGEIEPLRCGTCDYCKATKVLERPILSTDLGSDIR
jgi:hypothetical protein